ncbi:hypothetical protein DPX58_02540, partial [Salmonella enterica]|nr:hypothetical protein [Salmonella enterica]EBM1353019.1 hypothetical protein [Salmonella enterica]EBM3133470.1 hypothetical protein [Salmonella enterica]EBR8649208.1 hypothetical protein [Salmonella enterica subsp. enterica serovar Muenchen]ECS8394098.1 hypothetical protein [Salmonella enterica subsp. enterica serovar Muenchen]
PGRVSWCVFLFAGNRQTQDISMRFLKAAGVWLLLLLLFAAVVRQGLRLSGTAAILSSQK